MKYSNYIILFILLSVGVLFKDYINISTNLLSLFASKDAIEKLKIADSLGYSKELLIVVKGFDKSAKKSVKEISKKLQTVDDVLLVQHSVVPSQEVQDYYKKHYPLLANFSDKTFSTQEIQTKLQELYNSQLNSVFYTAIDKNDPLKLFNLELDRSNVSNRGEYITLGDYGYLIRVSTDVSASQMNRAKVLYASVNSLLSEYKDVISFAPFYYTVENSSKIQQDVRWILLLSTVVLLIIYYLLLRNIRLLTHTLVALFSSMIFAGLASTMIFTNFNLLSLAFGMSITAVSIDYLLHYHFHNFYQGTQKIDKNVLYGYLTTTVAFGIFSFIPIPIISQISFFAVVSLSFAYLIFTFVFPYLEIKEYVEKPNTKDLKKVVPAYIFFGLSVLLLLYSAFNIKLDSNIRNLDYQNEKLYSIQELFAKHNSSKLTPVIVEAQSEDELLQRLHSVHKKLPDSFSLASFVNSQEKCSKRKERLKNYDFTSLNIVLNQEASKIGFRENYFKDAYSFINETPACQVESLDIFKPYNLSIYKDSGVSYTIALVSDVTALKSLDYVSGINAKEMFSELATKMYKDLFIYSLVVVGVIFILLLFSVKRRLLYALNYIVFPISVTLGVLVSIADVNLMHLFSLIILIAIGIDYGIYMSNTNKVNNTMIAIKYSILSTFAAFGVLVFSSVTALHSIGIVISIGASAIFLLIKVMK